MGYVATGYVGSSWTRDGTSVFCIGRQILIHQEAPPDCFLKRRWRTSRGSQLYARSSSFSAPRGLVPQGRSCFQSGYVSPTGWSLGSLLPWGCSAGLGVALSRSHLVVFDPVEVLTYTQLPSYKFSDVSVKLESGLGLNIPIYFWELILILGDIEPDSEFLDGLGDLWSEMAFHIEFHMGSDELSRWY